MIFRHPHQLGRVYSAAIAPLPWLHPKYCHAAPNTSATPKKKALLIGICYTNTLGHDSDSENYHYLSWPWQDVDRLKDLLIEKRGHNADNIICMTDRHLVVERLRPTHDNIIRELQTFLAEQTPGDQYLVYYAGHSYQKPTSEDEGEEDGKDELILPCDALDSKGSLIEEKAIVDDKLREYLVEPLLKENHLLAIFDSCHSATLLDLPHHRCNRVHALTSRWRHTVRRVREAFWNSFEDLMSPYSFNTTSALTLQAHGPASCNGYCRRSKGFGNVLCISACKDSQQVTDAADQDKSESMTSNIISLLEKEPNPTLKQLMRVISDRLQASTRKMPEHYPDQILGPLALADPQISSLYPLNMNMPFNL